MEGSAWAEFEGFSNNLLLSAIEYMDMGDEACELAYESGVLDSYPTHAERIRGRQDLGEAIQRTAGATSVLRAPCTDHRPQAAVAISYLASRFCTTSYFAAPWRQARVEATYLNVTVAHTRATRGACTAAVLRAGDVTLHARALVEVSVEERVVCAGRRPSLT